MKFLKKAYRIACTAVGRRKVWIAIAVATVGVGTVFSRNDFNVAKTVTDVKEAVQTDSRLLEGKISGIQGLDSIKNSSIEKATITKISDGDTITVELSGSSYKIRMLEVDTPESVHADQTKNNAFGKEASEYTKSQLSVGQIVYLTKDQSDTDRYGRLLRLIWTEAPENYMDEQELRDKCYNAKLLLDGYAEVAIFDDKAYQKLFTKFQEEAMHARRGLWADDAWWEFCGLS